MSEMGDDIKPAVLAALPSLPEETLGSLLKKLSSLGVESEGDLQFVQEADLQEHITPLQCRRLLNAWRVEDEYVTLTAIDPAPAEDCTSSPSGTAPSPPRGPSPNGSASTIDLSSWPDNFVVPWTRMPSCVTTAIALNDRPTAKSRREMVRIIVDEMRLKELNPTRAHCITVAKKIVREYPNSFADVLRDGTRIGSGYGSLVTQIKTRVEHVNRGNTLSRHRKPKAPSHSSVEDVARGPADQYGCVRWQPDCPPDESDELLRRKQQEMKDLYSTEGPAGAERGHLGPLMEATYPLQRQAINACPPPSIADLKIDWPYLFTPKGLYNHFHLLTDISILEKMEQAVAEKGKLIINFFQHKPVGTDTVPIQAILRRFESSGETALGPCAVLLLLAHLNEEVEGLILQADVSATAADAEQALTLPDSPRLIVLGDVLTARQWMLSMGGQVVVPPHPDFVAGVAALFSAYYAFNLVYQEQASCTLEFIQRCFIGLNPALGTKVPSTKNRRNVRVSTLLRRLMDFDWLFM